MTTTNRIKVATLIFGILLVGIIGSTLWMNYRAQLALHRSALTHMRHDLARQAVNLEYFFTERKDDLNDLRASREISIFFENQALGMSMAYGLRASLLTIGQKFKDIVVNKRFYNEPIYTRLLFIDPSGTVLVDIDPQETPPIPPTAWAHFRTPDSDQIFVFEQSDPKAFDTMISAGYFFKGRYAGQLVAVLSKEIVFNHLLKPETEGSSRRLGIVCKHGLFHDRELVRAPLPAGKPYHQDGTDMARLNVTDLSPAESGIIRERSLMFEVPIKGTPFKIAAIIPRADILDSTPPWHLSLIMGIITIGIIGGMGALWRFNTQNTVLQTRLEETAIRERTIKKYQENLERLVEERTRDLKAAQNRLINKAMEAGRAQLSAMVLHNIGNALTPIGVFLSDLDNSNLRPPLDYLGKCHAEFKQHSQGGAEAFLQSPRGRDLIEFMGNLLETIGTLHERNCQTEKKISQAVGYISEIVTMQQAYAASEHEVKRRIDLNILMADAIRMQASALEKRDIHVIRKLGCQLPALIIDKNRLMQVLVNLIKNGYEAIDQRNPPTAKRTMTLRTYGDERSVGLAITDSGIGIEDRNTDKLFDLGHSGKGSSGFGLYYCKMFVQANHGNMRIDSPGADQGATVTIEFDRQGAAAIDEYPSTVAAVVSAHPPAHPHQGREIQP